MKASKYTDLIHAALIGIVYGVGFAFAIIAPYL
jgi:hypothetical protein